jgi:EAL domain-containing protein (putative c-di-GMP-specific phosphodiesterase class I)
MKIQKDYRPLGCAECAGGAGLDFDFTMAFQPILNTTTKKIFAQEALVRGLKNESAAQVFEHVNDSNRYRFDQSCRTKAIQLAAHLECQSFLSINFMPNAVYQPESCIRTTIEAAETFGFPIEKIIFEITEGEKVDDILHVREIVQYYKARGFKTAIDDFGAGYAGLNLLAEIQTDFIKLDMALIRHVDRDKSRQAIVRGIVQVCSDLSITAIAEGLETYEEMSVLQAFGIELYQGYYFAKPSFQSLVEISPSAFDRP